MAASNNLGPQWQPAISHTEAFEDHEGPFCPNCSDDIEEVMEWTGGDRQAVHPLKRVPCAGCGAV